MDLPKLIVILGPTTSGKTNLSVKLAKFFNGEIISADSRQIYRGMNIGTGKIKKSEMKNVPHYLIDIKNPDEKFNVVDFKRLAIERIKEIRERKKVSFLVGGTGLYIKSVVDNINFPEVAPRKDLRKELEKKEVEKLFEIYKELDPIGAKEINKKNKRRLIRAIEVSRETGKPYWEQRKKGIPIFNSLLIGIESTKESLEKQIEERVDIMIEENLEEEVRTLVEKYGWTQKIKSIGYQEWKRYFEEEIKKEEVKKLIALHTFQFAKRQMTWFRKEERINWIKNYYQAKKLISKFLK